MPLHHLKKRLRKVKVQNEVIQDKQIWEKGKLFLTIESIITPDTLRHPIQTVTVKFVTEYFLGWV